MVGKDGPGFNVHIRPDDGRYGSGWYRLVVVGTETGKRKGKSGSKPEWVDNIMRQTAARGIPTFMKEDLVPILGENRMIQQMPTAFLL